ncbi:MAG: DNA polymerase III subunit gamma/tau, partial [Dokdonella sp.]|uniref:DNA polymerase III subunit gamma/tau n=1 Tax=Dokdonella sp. TaxID=2291710 RepID=UPI003264DEF5
EIDAGRFVDLLEIDAASNTGVDNVRELIDNAMYVPTRGRYKVYLIDEVHMLTKNAFNALLKILEEPPPHVKFLLATTDPQKLLVTVLSRCIKFNLKRLTPEQITGQMEHILGAEGIAFDDEGIEVLSRAADGSLRDGLSLLDQAIAHGGGALRAEEVHSMLGTVERARVRVLLETLASGDGATLLDEVERLASFAPDFAQVLDEFAGLLHRVQLLQLIPGSASESDAELLGLGGRLASEDVQLWYQMAVTGRRDLPLAPTPRVGFEMALLRMLAFVPADGASATPSRASGTAAAARQTATPMRAMPEVPRAPQAIAPSPAPHRPVEPSTISDIRPASSPQASVAHSADAAVHGTDEWLELIERAQLRGPVGQLARHASLVAIEERVVRLALKAAHEHLAVGPMHTQLEQRIGSALGREIKIKFEGDSGHVESPADQRVRLDGARHSAAAEALHGDPFVQALVDTFGARVIPDSVRPADASAVSFKRQEKPT